MRRVAEVRAWLDAFREPMATAHTIFGVERTLDPTRLSGMRVDPAPLFGISRRNDEGPTTPTAEEQAAHVAAGSPCTNWELLTRP